MRRMWNFFKSKAFYFALGTGLVALATLLAVYNYTDVSNELTKEQGIDLNQPVAMEEGADDEKSDSVAANTNPVKKDDEKKETDEQTDTISTPTEALDETATEATDEKLTETAAEATDEKLTETATEAAAETTTEASEETQADNGENWSNETTDIVAGLEYDGEQLLIWPVIGNVILPFSMDTTVYFQTLDMYKCNPGMLIQGEEGGNVQAAYEGVVTAIEDTKEYGTVIRVNLGNGYEAMYGQVMNACVRVGDTVSMAQNIAEIAPVSSYYTEEGPHLYFAITKDGEPVNPMGLIQ